MSNIQDKQEKTVSKSAYDAVRAQLSLMQENYNKMAEENKRLKDIDLQYQKGKERSEKEFKELTGRDIKEFAADYVSSLDEAKKRKELGMNALEYAPIADQMKERAARVSSMLAGSGASQGAFAAKMKLQGDRAFDIAKAQMDVAAKERGRADYEKKLGNILRYGLTSSENRGALLANINANLQAAQIQADANARAQAQVNSGGGGKVICTELHRQGYFSDEIIKLDNEFGKIFKQNYPLIYDGYYVWAKHVVNIMRKNKLATKFVSIFSIPWAYYIAHLMDEEIEYSWFGKLVFWSVIPFCFVVGVGLKLYNKTGDLYARFAGSFKEKAVRS